MKARIGLFFGSFNPVHLGHTKIAHFILSARLVDRIWFIVSPHNPFKSTATLASFEHRLNMTRLAARQLPASIVSNVEAVLPRPSYTIHTLKYLKRIYPGTQFSLIIGLDNMESLKNWKNWQEILNNHQIIAYPRQNYTETFSHQNVVFLRNAPLLHISSSEIRQKIACSQNVSDLLATDVYQYILQHNLYM